MPQGVRVQLPALASCFRHLVTTYGDKYPVQQFSLAELQRHVERRSKVKHGKQKIAATTIKKEIVSLRTAWNWAVRMEFLAGKLPMSGLRYPKTDEKPAFMTRAEIERRIQAGGNAKTLWDALFLTAEEVSELLQFVKQHSKQPFLHPMVCFAAHTGARRSELIRAEVSDVDLTAGVVIVHERKRVHGKRTTRRLADAYCFSPVESERERRAKRTANRRTPLSCGNRTGTNQTPNRLRPPWKHYTTDSYRRAIHRVCQKLGIESWPLIDPGFPPPLAGLRTETAVVAIADLWTRRSNGNELQAIEIRERLSPGCTIRQETDQPAGCCSRARFSGLPVRRSCGSQRCNRSATAASKKLDES